jgi:glycosyltransferase involved in cell wall biosynthesis
LFEVPSAISPGDIIHLHGLTDWIGVAGLERLIPRDARVFQTVHGGWEVSGGCVVLCGTECQGFARGCVECTALRKPCKFLAGLELKAKCRFADKHRIHPIANSSWTARMIQRSLVYQAGSGVPILHPILDPAFVNSGGNGARASFGLPNDIFVIGIGARAVTDPYKGIAEFLQRLSVINDLVCRTVVLLFGEGKIACPQSPRVLELGSVTEPEMLAKILSASDLFVSPSSVESFGMLLMEAQAVGTPVLAFDVGGTADAVFPGLRRNLVPLHRWDLLFENVRRLVRGAGPDHELLKRMRSWALKSFAPSVIAKKQLQIYGIDSGVL